MTNLKQKSLLAATSLLVLLSAAGCQRSATGQVVAVVNGDEITLQEVNAELEGVQIPQNADRKLVQQQAVQRIVERRLIAASARNEGIDKEQDYLIGQRKVDDNLLVQIMGDRAAKTFRIPDKATIDRFMAERPAIFGKRTIYTIDRVQFPFPSDVNQLKKLEGDHTMEAAMAKLDSMGIKYLRNTTQMDTARLPDPLLKAIMKVPPGEPFAVPDGGMISLGVITGSAPAPLNEDQARPIAVQMMRQKAVNESLQQRLKTEQAAAKIEYQPGFAPTKPAKPKS